MAPGDRQPPLPSAASEAFVETDPGIGEFTYRWPRPGLTADVVLVAAPGVAHQWLVYSRAGHFSEIVSVAKPAAVTAYRLPFWHYTTPLVGTAKAARWVLLGTFLYR